MSCLPAHGRVSCSLCYVEPPVFDTSRRENGDWRITFNPLAWGGSRAEIVILGFSKGPNAQGALAAKSHNEIPYAGQRLAVAKILSHIGVIPPGSPEQMRHFVNRSIANPSDRIGWGSLVRCTVERRAGDEWKSSGGGMLAKFVATGFGHMVASNCVKRHLVDFPAETKLVVLFGMGTKLGYVHAARRLIQKSRPDVVLRTLNEVAYRDDRVVYVHVEHFAAQGSLIPDWLGIPGKSGKVSDRSRWGKMAQDAVREVLGNNSA